MFVFNTVEKNCKEYFQLSFFATYLQIAKGLTTHKLIKNLRTYTNFTIL